MTNPSRGEVLNKTMFFSALFFVICCLPSCTMVRHTATSIRNSIYVVDEPHFVAPTSKPPAMPEQFRSALQNLEQEKFEDALSELDQYVLAAPTSPYTQSMALASGRALEGLGRWSEAAARYRSVITATEKIAPKLQAMALYRLSFCNEALGDDQQTVAVLHDLQSRSSYLPAEVAQAELPARLAGSYARVGNFDKAVDYYRGAESGIMKLKQDYAGKQVPEWLPRTLYYMGSMALRRVTWDDFETAIRPLARAQTYLLQSAELGIAPWSARASKDLITTYQGLWSTIERAPIAQTPDPVVEQRAIEKKQIDRTALILETLHELRARIAPLTTVRRAQPAQEILTFLQDLDKEIQSRLSQRPAGEGLTRAALERRSGLYGRVVSPDSILEQKFLESAREVKTLPEKKSKKDPEKPYEKRSEAPSEKPGDPNL